MDDRWLDEIGRLGAEQPLPDDQARQLYGRLVDLLWADEPRVVREARLELILVERRRRLEE